MEPEQHLAFPRWASLVLGGIAVALVPWTLYLTYALPSRHTTDDWWLAWAGFDAGLAAALVATAVGVARAAAWLPAAAAVATTLLLTDAWFDIVLADPGGERVGAIVLAVVGEIPLALFCLWIALNAERAIRTLIRRARVPDVVGPPGGADGARAAPREARARPTRRA